MSKSERAFIWSSRAWYAKSVKGEEIMFGIYTHNGTEGEMAMRWERLQGKLIPQLQVFDDAWKVLAQFPDLIEVLGEHDNENITPQEFVEILKGRGFADFTAYKHP